MLTRTRPLPRGFAISFLVNLVLILAIASAFSATDDASVLPYQSADLRLIPRGLFGLRTLNIIIGEGSERLAIRRINDWSAVECHRDGNKKFSEFTYVAVAGGRAFALRDDGRFYVFSPISLPEIAIPASALGRVIPVTLTDDTHFRDLSDFRRRQGVCVAGVTAPELIRRGPDAVAVSVLRAPKGG